MLMAPKASARPVSNTPAPTRVCGQTAAAACAARSEGPWAKECEVVIVMVPNNLELNVETARRLVQATRRERGEAGPQTMPDLTMVARRLAKSSSTNLSKAGPVSTAGVQPFFSEASSQLLDLTALRIISVSTLRCSAEMPGAP